MTDPEAVFSLDEQRVFEQQIEMLGHRTRESVLNGYYRRLGPFLKHAIEDLGRAGTRKHCAGRLHGQSRFVAERTGFALDGYSHNLKSGHRVIGRNEIRPPSLLDSSEAYSSTHFTRSPDGPITRCRGLPEHCKHKQRLRPAALDRLQPSA